MIKISFRQFFRCEFEGLGFDLYIVRNAEQVLYIGISQVSAWERWFGGYESHMTVRSETTLHGNSKIGDVIERHFPDSWNWTVELWTKQDCFEALRKELDGQNAPKISIFTLEGYMIKRLKPLYNVMHADGTHEDPMISRTLDDAYRKIFEKK